MREIGIGECAQCKKVLQPLESPYARVLYGEALFDILEQHFDAPAAEVGVCRKNRGLLHGVRRCVLRDEVQCVEIESAAAERTRHDEDWLVRISDRETSHLPPDHGIDAPRRGA